MDDLDLKKEEEKDDYIKFDTGTEHLTVGFRSFQDMQQEQDRIFEELFIRFKKSLVRPQIIKFVSSNEGILKIAFKIFFYNLMANNYE